MVLPTLQLVIPNSKKPAGIRRIRDMLRIAAPWESKSIDRKARDWTCQAVIERSIMELNLGYPAW